MAEIIIKVEYCDQCPNAKISKVYTADSFEDVRKIFCKDQQKIVYGDLDWNEKSPVPTSCRFK